MKKIIAVFLNLIIISALILPSFAAPATGSSSIQGASTTLSASDIVNGKEFTMSMALYVDPSYDCFYAANFTFIYDNKLIDVTSLSDISTDSDYHVAAVQKYETQINAIVGNPKKLAPGADGYVCTVTLKMKVVDAAKLKEAGTAKIDIGLYNNDYVVYKSDEVNDYYEVADGTASYDMSLTFTPMTLSTGNATTSASYTVTYNTNGGSSIAAASVTEGGYITLPAPTRSGYSFEGWYTNTGLTTKATSPYTPTADITLYAKWTADSSGGGSGTDTGTTDTGTVTREVAAETGAGPSAVTTTGSDDSKQANSFTITYNTNGGNSISAATANAGSSVTLPTPDKSGYTFAGWYSDSDLTTKVTSPCTPASDMTLYAKWTETVLSGAVPKTGVQSNTPLIVALIVLCLCAGVVVFIRFIKIRSGK